MSSERQVYLLDPQKLSPETIAVTFAKTSRSPQSFQEIASELSQEKSAEFHERWVVGYGHASVAEHAVLHIAVENISRLAVENLESNRLASYTEKSTRYQKWDPSAYYFPAELIEHSLAGQYRETIAALFETYQKALPLLRAVVEKIDPRHENESEAAWERRVRSQYVDVARYLLPAASLANVGVTINARNLEHAICKLLSDPLDEVRALGLEMRKAALEQVPTLVKYAEHSEYMELSRITSQKLALAVDTRPRQNQQNWCVLSKFDSESEINTLAAMLYHGGQYDYAQYIEYLHSITDDQRRDIANQVLAKRGKFDLPPREMEYSQYTFDVTVDQGAYFEIKRHRMMTQTPQVLTAALGYAVPSMFKEAGFEAPYHQAMQLARDTYHDLYAFNPSVASYVVPNGFNRRFLLASNWRALDHFIALRSAPNAHFAVRRVAQCMAEQIRTATPLLGAHLRPQSGETWQEIETSFFTETSRKA